MMLAIIIVACLVLILDKTGFMCTEDIEKLIYRIDDEEEVAADPNPDVATDDIDAKVAEALENAYGGDK